MPTNKNRVMFLCDDKAKNDLQQWAEQERRSISNLVEKIVLEAIADWKQQQPPAAPPPEPEPPASGTDNGGKGRGKKGGEGTVD